MSGDKILFCMHLVPNCHLRGCQQREKDKKYEKDEKDKNKEDIEKLGKDENDEKAEHD